MPSHSFFPANHSKSRLFGNDSVFFGVLLFIGKFCMIASGVEFIMNGANAYSVVTKDVAPYAVVGGNPARELRLRFPEEQIQELLELRWWDWPVEEITRKAHLLTGNDIDALR